jgi:hypothetical protein
MIVRMVCGHTFCARCVRRESARHAANPVDTFGGRSVPGEAVVPVRFG